MHSQRSLVSGYRLFRIVGLIPSGLRAFYRLMAQMRTSHPDESQLMLLVFDLLHQDGVDLRGLPLSERKRDLHRLCVKSRVPFLKEVQTFPNGPLLFDHCNKFGFKGVVSKRLASRYSSGPSRNWVKSKCPGWKRINSERYRLFEGPPRKPELTKPRRRSPGSASTRQGARAPAITAAEPRHGARAAQACHHCRAGNR